MGFYPAHTVIGSVAPRRRRGATRSGLGAVAVPGPITQPVVVSDVAAAAGGGIHGPLVAAAITAAVVAASPSKKRFTPTWLLSAVFAGAGFLISGWVGVAAVAAAASYRMFQNLRAPWQAWATIGGTVTFFAFAVYAANRWLGADDAGDGSGWVPLLAAAAGMFLAGWAVWRGWAATKYPYRGMGVKVPRGQMFRGRVNRHLVVLPEEERDPRRLFTSSERSRRLNDQGGVCAFQARIGEHPRWEPFRPGVQWHGDHIVPHSRGGATVEENLQVLCADCNSAKLALYGADGVRAARLWWRQERKRR